MLMENLYSNRHRIYSGSRDWTRPASFSQENWNPNQKRKDNMMHFGNNIDKGYNSYHAQPQKRARVQFESKNPSTIASYNLSFVPQLSNTIPVVQGRSVAREVRPTLQQNRVGSTTESNSVLPFLPSTAPLNDMTEASLNFHGIEHVGSSAIKKPNSANDARVLSSYGGGGVVDEVRLVLQRHPNTGSNSEPPVLPSTMSLNAFHGVGPVGGKAMKNPTYVINDKVPCNRMNVVQNQSSGAAARIMGPNLAPVAVLQGNGADTSQMIGSNAISIATVSSTNQYGLSGEFSNLTENTLISLLEEKQKQTQVLNAIESIFQGPNVTVTPQILSVVSQYLSSNQFSNLVNSLADKGLVNSSQDNLNQTNELNNQEEKSEEVLDFNSEFLKTRHESVIRTFYADLTRQCTACGQRFKSQEDHRNHMDWHVKKNRMKNNSNSKQNYTSKKKPSRNWFASAGSWMSARSGEETDTKTMIELLNCKKIVEKKDEDGEFVVPADEDQKLCALCREEFEDFFSDEADDWMYKGAVYMNVAKGKARAHMDRYQLGPIVHVKCMPESKKSY